MLLLSVNVKYDVMVPICRSNLQTPPSLNKKKEASNEQNEDKWKNVLRELQRYTSLYSAHLINYLNTLPANN